MQSDLELLDRCSLFAVRRHPPSNALPSCAIWHGATACEGRCAIALASQRGRSKPSVHGRREGVMSDEPKGLSYVPQINKAYDDLVTSNRTSLVHALKFGELLNQAKEAVGHGDWTNWLKTNCPQISHRTANVYMSLVR
jgi:hypothetical protein